MSPALLAGIEADLPDIGRGNVSTAKDCVQELFPLNRLLAHADTMPMYTAKIRKQLCCWHEGWRLYSAALATLARPGFDKTRNVAISLTDAATQRR